MVSNLGYYSFNSIFDYEIFPECAYKWNGFLLESVIAEYNTGFQIIYPQVRDHRYQRGVIVPNNSTYSNFENLIVGILKANDISSISEAGLEKFLRIKGVITNVLPQEVYECPQLSFKIETFSINSISGRGESV